MNVGMLWFDNDPKIVLTAKVARAAKYYSNKYGKSPTVCFVHPSMMPVDAPSKVSKNGNVNGNGKSQNQKVNAGEVEIKSSQSIMPDHFWIGVNGRLNTAVPGD